MAKVAKSRRAPLFNNEIKRLSCSRRADHQSFFRAQARSSALTDLSTKAPDPMDIALGAAVRIRRRSLGISQETLAEQCGVSFQQIQKYENGTNRISFSRLVQIARALQCRVVDLMDVLDASEGQAGGDVDILTRMRTPGALELLAAYERLRPEARTSLLSLLRTLGGEAPVEAPA
jgi:transcriptional regulator with XRE-family HTH domain